MNRHAVEFDPAVLAVLSDSDKRARERSQSPAQRRRGARDESRTKATYDLPAWLMQEIADLAEAVNCSKSSLAAFLLAKALDAYHRGDFNFDGCYQISRSPRYHYVLVIPDNGETEGK